MAARPKPDTIKHCEQCGLLMARKRIGPRLEDLGVFRRRRFCNQACMGRAFLKVNPTLAGYRARAKKIRKDACEVCESKSDLHAHHMDEDPSNNDPKNVATLCGSCHQIWHWHFGRNRSTKSARETAKIGSELSATASSPSKLPSPSEP